MKIKKEILERILNVVQKAVFGLTFEEIVKETGHHRATVKKYLDLLEKWGFIVHKRIGYYTLVFPASIYEFMKNDFPGLYISSLIKILWRDFDFDRDKIQALSQRVAKDFSLAIINVIRKFLSNIDEKIEDLAEVVIPSMTPYLKFKIKRFRLADKLLYIEVLEFKTDDLSEDLVCEFLRGYLSGLLEALDVKFDKIETIEKIKQNGKVNCKLVIILKEPIEEITEKLKSKLKIKP
mgnify:CR=1 FL=1